MAAPGKGLIFWGVVAGAGFVFTALGLAPATREALPFGIGMLLIGLAFAIPGAIRLRRRFASDGAGAGGFTLEGGPAGLPSSVECPNCRSPAPLCLKEPRSSTCAFCGHRFALPPELAERLSKGAALVKAQSEAERHIADSVAKLAERQASWIVSLRWLTRAMLVISVLVGAYAVVTRNTNDWWHGYAAFALASGALAAWLAAKLRRQVPDAVQRILGHWSALKLPNSDALGCRVCGGPLPRESKPVLRCDYCSADNLAGAGVLALISKSAAHATAGALAVGQRRQQGEELLAFALSAYLPITLVGWFGLGAFAGSGFTPVGDVRIWTDSSARFALIRTDGTRPCIAVTRDVEGGVELRFDHDKKVTVPKDKLERISHAEPIPPAALVGRELYARGRVAKVFRHLRWPDRHMAEVEGWSFEIYFPSHYGGGEVVCLAEESKGESIPLP